MRAPGFRTLRVSRQAPHAREKPATIARNHARHPQSRSIVTAQTHIDEVGSRTQIPLWQYNGHERHTMEDPHFDEQSLIEKIRSLPPDKAVEVEDFVDFLRRREERRQLVDATTRLSEVVFQRIWDNPEDAIYDQL